MNQAIIVFPLTENSRYIAIDKTGDMSAHEFLPKPDLDTQTWVNSGEKYWLCLLPEHSGLLWYRQLWEVQPDSHLELLNVEVLFPDLFLTQSA